MTEITTKDDWWNLVEQEKENLRNMIASFHPAQKMPSPVSSELAAELSGITAPGAEVACRMVREEIAEKESGLPRPVGRFNKAFAEQDWQTLGSLFSATWFGVPESVSAHSIPGFGALCDLCSENWVFQDEDEV